MKIESPKAYYDRKRKEFENTCPARTNRGQENKTLFYGDEHAANTED